MGKQRAKRRPTIRERMDATGKTRQQIADAAGLSKPYVVQLATGARVPGPVACLKLAPVLKCRPHDLRPDLAAVFQLQPAHEEEAAAGG